MSEILPPLPLEEELVEEAMPSLEEEMSALEETENTQEEEDEITGDEDPADVIEKATGLTSDLQDLIKQAGDDLLKPENDLRTRLLTIIKRNELYWDGKQRLIFDGEVSSYKTPQEFTAQELAEFEIDPVTLNGIINITKAHGESVIGAMSTGTPRTRFFPKNANKAEDILESRARTKLAECIEDENDADGLIVSSLSILMKQHFVAAHIFNAEDSKFGTYEKRGVEETVVQEERDFCPDCASDVTGFPITEDPTTGLQGVQCQNCGGIVQPERSIIDVPYMIDTTETIPETRTIIDVYGPKNVRIPLFCANLRETPYLVLEKEVHISKLRDMYPRIADSLGEPSDAETLNTWSRLPYQYLGERKDTITVQYRWIRPWGLEILGKDNRQAINSLKKAFPSGFISVIINDILVDVYEEAIDEYWVIEKSKTSDYLHDEPMMNCLIPLQDMTNDLVDLIMETIRQGISETFVDQEVVDLKEYSKKDNAPGSMTAATPRMGMGMDSAFYQTKGATLSAGIEYFQDYLTKSAQFVMGSFPSIYGGSISGAHTASEYAQSRNQALQRLSIKWKTLITWWGKVISNAVACYIKYLKESQREETTYTKAVGDSYINITVRLSELMGEIGRVKAESSEDFPSSWSQRRQDFMELLTSNNEAILSSIFTPNNIEVVYQLLGLSDLQIPGEEDRNKQLFEITQLIKGEPIPTPAGFVPSIAPEFDIDDNEIHLQICKEWLLGPEGLDAKGSNPNGYNNVFAHYKQHLMDFMMKERQKMMEQAALDPSNKNRPPQGGDGKKPPNNAEQRQ